MKLVRRARVACRQTAIKREPVKMRMEEEDDQEMAGKGYS